MSSFTDTESYGRKISLMLYPANPANLLDSTPVDGTEAMDLSKFRIQFHVEGADVESPNNAMIRVFNLTPDTARKLRTKEFANIVLNAGYENGNYGTIFRGNVKQYRIGRLNGTDTYIDFLCADGDIGYNQAFMQKSLAAGATQNDTMAVLQKSIMGEQAKIERPSIAEGNVPTIRGQVLFGMSKALMRNQVSSLNSTWNIQDGRVVITPRDSYTDGDIIELNIATGLVGIPEQTSGGVEATCLLNSRLKLGNKFRINQQSINKTLQAGSSQTVFNKYAGIQWNAALAEADGFYRAFVITHSGDTRGNEWNTKIIGLSMDVTAAKQVSPQ
jgi:hypothetical protein